MENIYYVYEWIRLDTNEPFYVGMGHGKRCYQLTRGNNKHFNNIVKSIPVAVNILHDNLDRQIAFDLEVWYIREYRDIIGYESICNINDGGEGNTLCGELNPMYGKNPREGKTEEELKEWNRKISENHADLSGKNHPMYGKHLSEETKRKLSEANKGENNPKYWKGKHLSEETKRKLSEANKGKIVSEETRKKLSEAGKGRTHTEESKDKIRESKKDKMTHIICLNDKKIYESITKASLNYKIERASIRNCCNGYYTRKGKKIKYTNCKGYKFRYLTYKHSKVLRPINYKFKKAI